MSSRPIAPAPKPGRAHRPPAELFGGSVSHVDIIEELARRAESLGRSRIDPETFHVEKSELATGLRRLAGRMRRDGDVEPTTVWRAAGAHTRRTVPGAKG